MNIGLTYSEAAALSPCQSRFEAAIAKLGGLASWAGKISAQQAKQRGCSLDDVIWAATAVARSNKDVERRLRLWLADCAARVLHIYEKSEPSLAPREAIIATRLFARGEIDDAARGAARDAAWATARATAWDAARGAAWAAAWAAAGAAAGDAAWATVWAPEEEWQFTRLCAWLSDDEPADWPLPATTKERQK